MIRLAHSCQPHEVDALLQRFFYLAATINIIDISVNQRFEQHPGMIAAGSSRLILLQQTGNVYFLQHFMNDPHRVTRCYQFVQTGGEGHELMLVVGLKHERQGFASCYALIYHKNHTGPHFHPTHLYSSTVHKPTLKTENKKRVPQYF